jgi:predicted nuclease of predicted toxin-antitoxin system
MKILVDENIPRMTVASLRSAGHDVLDVRGTEDQGALDEQIWRMALQQERLLVSTDKGFVHRRDDAHFGLLVVRLRRPNGLEIHRRVMSALAQFSTESWPGLVVVMRDAVQSVWRASQEDSDA